MSLLMCILVFAGAYSIKGGWAFKSSLYAKLYDSLPKIAQNVLSCKLQAAVIVLAFSWYAIDFLHAVFCTLAWILAVSPSIRDEALAAGRFGFWSGGFKELGYSRSSSAVRSIQRGVWMGAMFTLMLGAPIVYIPILGIGFYLSYFIGQEIYYRVYKTDSWTYSEPIMGAFIGLAYYLGEMV